MIEHAVMGLCARLPRGGFALAKAARRWLPGLANYPARLQFAQLEMRGDVSQNVFYPLAVRGYYTHQVVEDDLLAMLARRSQHIVDVGANIGFTAALLATYAPAGARIWAFEPLPLCAQYLQQVNAAFANVEVIDKAVGETPGVAQFLHRQSIDRSSLAGKGDAPVVHTIDVEVTTLDSQFPNESIDLLKIDVEGFEPAVLKGGRRLISRSQPIVVFEAYEREVLDFAVTYFQTLGPAYELYAISSLGELLSLEDTSGAAPNTCNFVAWPFSRTPPPSPSSIPRCYNR